MTIRKVCVGIVHAILLLMTSRASAQSQPGPEGLILRSEARLVVLPVRVLDAKGRPVEPPLARSAFSVFEDGVEQSIGFFAREDIPSSIALLIDHSGSMSYKLQAVAEAALTFVGALHPRGEICVISFSEHAYVDAPFTTDVTVLTDALGRGTIRGNTALYDAIDAGMRHMNRFARYSRRILILMSDGEDVASSVKPADLIRSLQAAEVTVYAFGLGQISGKSRRTLKTLAESTGGELSALKDLSQYKVTLSKLAWNIKQQYTLAYSPSRTGEQSGCHEVRVTLRSGYKGSVFTRTGYCEAVQ